MWAAHHPRDRFLIIQNHRTTIFTDTKEWSTVLGLKCILEDILKRPYDEQYLDDDKTLGECGFTNWMVRPHAQWMGLAF